MVAQTSIPDPVQAFRPDPERVTEFLDALVSPNTSLQQVAAAWETTVGALCLFIESEAGLELLGGIEFAMALRLRITALATLPATVATLNAIVQELPRDEDTASLRSSIQGLKLLEFKRNNARRAGALLFRIATHQPRVPRRFAIASTQPRGEALAASTVVAQVGAANPPTHESRVSSGGAQTCGTPKRPLGRGEVSTFASPSLSAAPFRVSALASLAGSALPSGP